MRKSAQAMFVMNMLVTELRIFRSVTTTQMMRKLPSNPVSPMTQNVMDSATTAPTLAGGRPPGGGCCVWLKDPFPVSRTGSESRGSRVVGRSIAEDQTESVAFAVARRSKQTRGLFCCFWMDSPRSTRDVEGSTSSTHWMSTQQVCECTRGQKK